jgi:ATP-dependent DNA helicase DinG
MRDVVVAIDLETTGLDVAEDRIIEIGAVRMQAGEVLEEYGTLINPSIVIPDYTTLLTGIHPEDVVGAPRIEDVLPDLLRFVGDAPIIGHSVGFDLSFLNKHGLFTSNTPLDTYDLAAVLLPREPRYNLTSLTQAFGIVLEDAHRALDDARASGILYWELYRRAVALPLTVLDAINQAASGIDWRAKAAFDAALSEKRHLLRENQNLDDNLALTRGPQSDISHLHPLRPNDEVVPLDIEDIGKMFGQGGALSQAMPRFEFRPQQQDMAQRVANAFNENQHLLIEAGTGTGKSIAYLIPAFEWAANNNERVVISTDTIALQDQLLTKDIPALQNALGVNLNAAVLKGRANYLCPVSVEAMKRRGPTNIEELRVLAKILVWQLETESGDKTEISLRGAAENSIWRRLSSAEGEGCRGNMCKDELGYDCPFYRAYKKAEAAHLLIVNHALLIADAKAENRVLPDYEYIVIDEGHHLEDAVTNSMSFSLDEAALIRRLNDLGNEKRGLLVDMVTSLTNSNVPKKTVKRIQSYAENVNQAANEMRSHVQALFRALDSYAQSTGQIQGSYVTHLRINPDNRDGAAFGRIRAAWEVLQQFMDVIAEATGELSEFLSKLENYDIDNYVDLLRNTQTVARYLNETRASLSGFIQEPSPNTIYWLSVSQDGRQPSLNSAPLHVGPLITKNLWHSRRSVIVTSATLRTNGSFEHLQERIHADEADTHEVGSPFNYKEAALIYLPTDIPEPREYRRYQSAFEQAVIDMAAALDGRVMVLFTSYSQLRQTSKAITPRLALGNITVYDQSDGTSRKALLEGFKATEKSVLLGTRSFWEGVDVPGDALSGLVIARLPFPVPSDPIVASRSEMYSDPFNEYTIPEAILRFRQGFGRLIRTTTDRGIVAIMDNRITTKSYGAAFLDALPECTIKSASLTELPTIARDWLDQTK